MGTWSVGPFCNDDAADWAYELEEAEDFSLIEESINAVLAAGDEYVEAPEAAIALAAIEVLARLAGGPSEQNSPSEIADKWAAEIGMTPPAALYHNAHAAITRILADESELKELWQESDEYDAWHSNVLALKARIPS